MPSSLLTDDEFETVRQAFLADTTDRLAEMKDCLSQYSASRQLEPLRTLARAAHTIKGDAATVGLDAIAIFATHLQNALDTAVASGRPCSDALVETVAEAVAFLGDAIPRGLAGDDTPLERAAGIAARLSASEART